MNTKTIENFLKNMSILYVESDELFYSQVTKALKIKSNHVYSYKSFNDAIKIIKNVNFDILITEINLKDGNGFDLIDIIKEKYEQTEIIVLSSIVNKETLLKAIKLNLVDYITKPINITQLREALKLASQKILNNGYFEVKFDNNISYNFRKKELSKNGKIINITRNETSLLDALILNQHCILSIEAIKDIVWDDGYYVNDIAFKSLLSRLRSKIGKESINNISGSGYVLNIK